MTPVALADRRGQVVMGRYRIVRRLAQGGMGVVYLARTEGAKGFVRPAVIKQMLPDLAADEELVRLFVREARILSELRHPGIVSVLDFAVEGDAYLMALEYVHGYHAGHWLKYLRRKRETFEPALAIHVVIKVLDALSYVHGRLDEHGRPLGIVHRDVSPSNVLIDVEGRVRLVDFGVARIGSDDTATSDSGGVTIKGKFAYLAPELLRGEPPSIASDVFACGVVLHELLSGRNELRASSPTETLQRVMRHALSSLEIARGELPAGIDAAIRRATAREPSERFGSAGEMAAALRALGGASERELEARLGEAARKAFEGGLPDMLGLPSLAALERAWRDPSDVSLDVVVELEPDRSRAVTVPEPDRRQRTIARGRWRWAAGALGSIALAALGIAVFHEREPASGAVVVVDPRSVDPPASAEPPRSRSTAEDAPAEPSSTTEESTPPDPAAQVTRAFRGRRAAVERCFAEHAMDALEVSIRFRIDREGRVERADVLPASVARTALGECLREVARQTDFGPQRAPMSFRIPITVRG